MGSTTTILTGISNRTKPTMASSSIVGLTVRATGEEQTQLIDSQGNVYIAGIPAPTAAPVLLTYTGSSGMMTVNQHVGYVYVWAATTDYPFVENSNAINGSIAPRGNPSPYVQTKVPASGGIRLQLQTPPSSRPDLNAIWIFRTQYYATNTPAANAAQAGLAYYVGSVTSFTPSSTVNFDDLATDTGTDQVESDNFTAPTFALVHFNDPYWWGFGNFQFQGVVNVTTGGIATLQTSGDQWFTGRNGQNVKLLDSSGNLIGTYTFSYLSLTTCQLLNADGSNATLGSAVTGGTISIQGPSTTLYRSKERNPLSWGETTVIGTVDIPSQYVYKVGGGKGTGIFSVPSLPFLILSTESPAGMYSLDLRQAGTDGFEASKRTISEVYSATSHWSQFAATDSNGVMSMWALDCKNYCIIQCNGITVTPISQPISKTLRSITTNYSQQLLAHGAYEPFNQLNCIWFTTQNSLALCNFLVYQHAPTGNWFMADDKDVLCSALYQDPDQNVNKIFVGTETGFVGQAFAQNQYSNWLTYPLTSLSSTSIYTGLVASATGTTITSATVPSNGFNSPGIVGNWCLLTDGNGENEQWARISSYSQYGLTFDRVYSYTGGGTTAFNPVPSAGWQYFIGLIEFSVLKYFDLSLPANDKKMEQLFATLQNVDSTTNQLITRFYKQRDLLPYDNLVQLTQTQLASSPSDLWFIDVPPSLKTKSFGLEFIERGYLNFRLFNYAFKSIIMN